MDTTTNEPTPVSLPKVPPKLAPWRLTVHGDSSRATQGKIAEALQAFVTTVEAIEGHGVYLAQFEGSQDYLRLRGEDTTMVETVGSEAVAEDVPAIFREASVFAHVDVANDVETRTERQADGSITTVSGPAGGPL